MESNVKIGLALSYYNKRKGFRNGILLLLIILSLLFNNLSRAKSVSADTVIHPSKPLNNKLSTHRTVDWRMYISTNIKINGGNRSEIECGDSLKLEFSFFPGRTKAELSVFIDANNDEVFDKGDLQYGKSLAFTDGDINDLDKKFNSHYKTIISKIPDMDIPVNCIMGKTIFFLIDDGINHSIATLKVTPPLKSFFLSGLIKNPRNRANLGIMIQSNDKYQEKYLTFTDKDGYFQMDVPDRSNDPYYYITSDDYFNILNNHYFQPLPVVIDKRIRADNVSLSYSIKTSFITGRITDLENTPIKTVKVYAQDPDNSAGKKDFLGITDSTGYYRIGVSPGLYKISINADNLFPNYMYPEETDPVNVLEGQVKDLSFKLLKADGIIKGKVRFDGKAARNIYVAAWNDKGSIWSKTNADGIFILKANKKSEYHIDINPESIPSGYFLSSSNFSKVKPDSEMILFDYEKASVKFVGVVREKESGLPVENVLITATDGKYTAFTRTDVNGRYSIMGEGGSYFLFASKDDLSFGQADTNLIANNGYYNVDFHLNEPNEKATAANNKGIKDEFVYNQAFCRNSAIETKIKYILPKFSHVILKIYDITGKEIATLEDKRKSAGVYEINFDSSKLARGVYIYKLIAGHFSETKKFLIAR